MWLWIAAGRDGRVECREKGLNVGYEVELTGRNKRNEATADTQIEAGMVPCSGSCMHASTTPDFTSCQRDR